MRWAKDRGPAGRWLVFLSMNFQLDDGGLVERSSVL